MTTVRRPSRTFSFADWTRAHPRDPVPGDRLDAQFFELIEAIKTTQAALAEIRRDDGRLSNRSVDEEQLATGLRQTLVGNVAEQLEPIQRSVSGVASAALESERNAQLAADDALAAVSVAQQLASGVSATAALITSKANYVAQTSQSVTFDVTDAQNWANYSQAQADNAIAAKDEALKWAEYLAGPVVNPADAPAYIAGSPFGSGLYYQPVEGGLAGLWSAKWWALYAQALVGPAGFYYLGGWSTPPSPGEQNPNTGQMVPNPLSPGSLYYNTVDGVLYSWNGTHWAAPAVLTPAFSGHFLYTASAGQTAFSGADANGQTPTVGTSPSDVHVNGIRLAPTDYTVDPSTNKLTISEPLNAGSVVQWDLLLPQSALAPVVVHAYKILPITLDGSTRDFLLKYSDPNTGNPVNAVVGNGAQLLVSLDGIVQEPSADYTAGGSNIHFTVAPPADGHLFIIWYAPS